MHDGVPAGLDETLRLQGVPPIAPSEVWCNCPPWATAEFHQPRERAVPCHSCRRPTLEVHGVCSSCGVTTCDRCEPAHRGGAVTTPSEVPALGGAR